MQIIVQAIWDNEADVWVASSSDLPGLHTEADTAEQLVTKLSLVIPDLLAVNQANKTLSEVAFCIRSERWAVIPTPAIL